jgi:TPR repeat protein
MPSHRNDDEIFARLMLKAQVGKAWAQDAIASRCQDGKGVSEDLVEVAAWHKKAAEQGWFKVLITMDGGRVP